VEKAIKEMEDKKGQRWWYTWGYTQIAGRRWPQTTDTYMKLKTGPRVSLKL